MDYRQFGVRVSGRFSTIRDRSRSLPRWALDGGNGSVVTVGGMTEKDVVLDLYMDATKLTRDQQLQLMMWLMLDLRAELRPEEL